jgi:hypothetical protein
MTDVIPELGARSYGCSFGCGNPYDYIVISVVNGEVEFLCLPCYVKLASDMVAAVLEPQSPEVQEAMRLAGESAGDQAPGPRGRRRGHNAPATTDDDDILSAFESAITYEELPDEFK